MGGMARIIPLPVSGAADGGSTHFWLVAAANGAFCASGLFWTFICGQVGMVGGPGMVGGHLCASTAFKVSFVVFGFKLGL